MWQDCAEFFYAALWVLWFSHGVCGLPCSDGTVYYTISAAEAPEAVILNVGDTVTVKYAEGEGSILQAYSVAKAVPAA